MKNSCVYCSAATPKQGFPKEHVITRGLGKFLLSGEELVITDRVCGDCNDELGKCDGELCYAGPEAMFRRRIGIKGRIRNKKEKKDSPFHPNRRAREPIKMTGKRKNRDHEDHWEIDEKGELRERLSYQFTHPDTLKTVSVPINSEMTNESFREAIRNAGHPGGNYPGDFFCDDKDRPWIEKMLGEDAKKMAWEDRRIRPDKEAIEITAEMTITPRHHRAIAKIAFNYLMHFSPLGLTGAEPAFDKVRQFIRYGSGHPRGFVRRVEGDILEGLDYGLALANYGHLVACEIGPKVIKARVQLCTGREMRNGCYQVFLGQYPFAILAGDDRVGHYFRITSAPSDSKDQGDVIPMVSAKRIIPVQLRPRRKKLWVPCP